MWSLWRIYGIFNTFQMIKIQISANIFGSQNESSEQEEQVQILQKTLSEKWEAAIKSEKPIGSHELLLWCYFLQDLLAIVPCQSWRKVFSGLKAKSLNFPSHAEYSMKFSQNEISEFIWKKKIIQTILDHKWIYFKQND